MIRLLFRRTVPFVLSLILSGCTDIVEPNQLAFVLGTSIDPAEGGQIEVGHQIVIPTQKSGPFDGLSESSEGFVVLSATGRDVFEASEKVQKKLSRKLMTSHRILIAISEDFINKNDVSALFDKLNRDPANNERDVTVMIKGSAKQFLMLGHPMEHLSSIAADKEMQVNGLKSFSTRQFIIDSVSEGTRPLLPTLQIQNAKLSSKITTPIAQWSGYAFLNKQLKVKGTLNETEGSGVLWMSGKMTSQGLTVPWKDGKGALSFRLTHLRRQIRSGGNPEHVVLTVKAQAYLLENTTSLDMSDLNNKRMAERYVNDQLQKDLQAAMDRVRNWGTDAFGIGEHLHRKHPYWWKKQRDDWDDKFKSLNVTVKADIKLRSSGTSGAQLKP